MRGLRAPNAKAPPPPTKTLTAPDGTAVEAVSAPFDRSGQSTALARLGDGTEIEVGMEIAKVFRGVIDRGDHYEVVHSLIFEQSLTTSGVPPSLLSLGTPHSCAEVGLKGEPSVMV